MPYLPRWPARPPRPAAVTLATGSTPTICQSLTVTGPLAGRVPIAEYLRLPSHWPQRAGGYRSAISERSESGRAYRPSGGGPAWQSRGRVWRRVWAPS
jgi:hypothetical protein